MLAKIFAAALIISAAAAPAFADGADAAKGKLVFLQCQACHAVTPGAAALVGPDLAGIYGAKAASRPGYDYSDALKNSGITWTPDKLDAWLASPSTLVPGTKMAFVGIASPTLRADVIAYLATLK